MTSISRKMAQFALGLKYDNTPEAARHEAKRFLLDSIGCALAAVDHEDMLQVYEYVRRVGGKPQATIIGHGTRTDVANAALMNALLIRAMDYNDIYWKQDPSHPSDILPAALAPAEYRKLGGKDLIAGMLIAYELEMRLCLAATPGVREVGWHHATLTQFVSPFVAGRMLGLSEDQLVAACGISGSSHFTLGGVVAGHLTNMKNTADPMATEAGVRAAVLASTGYTGPVEVFEGKEGVFHVLGNVKWDAEVMTRGLGSEFLITECGYKAFPTEALTHQPITAVLEVMEENGVDPHSLRSILVKTTTRGADILSDPSKYDPKTKETADHSLPYCVAVAAAKGNVLPSDFEADALADPFVRSLLGKIQVVAEPSIDALFPKVKRAVVTVTIESGESYTRQEDFAKGSTERPLSDDDVAEKFRSNASATLSDRKIERVVEATFRLEEFETTGDYMRLLARSR
ncbi:MAG: MmgE/PrpD family protein [Candidatus Bipolaricaulota bacterium]|nr:MmgE/PrpD family protein [Candidatus Bipolaricaulota bacterium]